MKDASSPSDVRAGLAGARRSERALGIALLVAAHAACAEPGTAPRTIEPADAADAATECFTPRDASGRDERDAALADADTGGLAWQRGQVPIDEDGRSARVSIDVSRVARPVIVIRTYAAAPSESRGLCFQLEDVAADGASPWVPRATALDFGDYCVRCAQRVAVGAGYGLFVLPSAHYPSERFSALGLRVALRDCQTLSPRRRADTSGTLVVESAVLSEPAQDRQLTLSVGIAIATPHAFSEAGALDEVVAEVRRIWSQAKITLVTEPPIALTPPAAPLVYGPTDRAGLGALARAARDVAARAGRSPRSAWVIVTPCLIRVDEVFSSHTQPLAHTAHVPGGFGVHDEADAIFVAGERCGGLVPGARYTESLTAGAVIAHEIGHFLGLFHVREADGREDGLHDTAPLAGNLMQTAPDPLETLLTQAQIAVARRHPALAVAAQD